MGVPRFGTSRVPLHPSAISALRHPSWVENEDYQAQRAGRKEKEEDEVGDKR